MHALCVAKIREGSSAPELPPGRIALGSTKNKLFIFAGWSGAVVSCPGDRTWLIAAGVIYVLKGRSIAHIVMPGIPDKHGQDMTEERFT
jgi:hypothetical protein